MIVKTILIFVSNLYIRSLKYAFFFIKSNVFFLKPSKNSSKGVIPPLNIATSSLLSEKSSVSDKSLKNCMKKLIQSRLLQENSCISRRASILTDRRSDKLINPSLLPSSIFYESDNSVTDRIEFHQLPNKKKVKKIKDFENFFDSNAFSG